MVCSVRRPLAGALNSFLEGWCGEGEAGMWSDLDGLRLRDSG
jgi:hypothetical protein